MDLTAREDANRRMLRARDEMDRRYATGVEITREPGVPPSGVVPR